MGSFGWGDLIAVVAVLVSLASLTFTVRTSRDAEAAAAAAAKRQEHMARSFDELVAAARKIADAASATERPGALADRVSAPQWQVENPRPGHYRLRNLSSATRHGVRISTGAGDPTEAVDLSPLADTTFTLPGQQDETAAPTITVTDAEQPDPVELPVYPWF